MKALMMISIILALAGSVMGQGRFGNTAAQIIDLTIDGQVQGDMIYYDGTNWTRMLSDTTEFVLSSAAATITTLGTLGNVILDTEGAAALDTVTTLTGFVGQIIFVSSKNAARDVRFLDAGNFSLSAEQTLSDPADVLMLKATSATTWKEISFSDNN